jgi:glycosyltransferase involved in cell wall biosynthesis
MGQHCPVVSICLPVYNGERHISYALTSIVEQTFDDLELIITDNASTDGTGAICRAAEARDGRVRYFRSDRNRGLAANNNWGCELSRGRYIAWIGHDDVMDREYIARCVAALEADPEAVLCFANTIYIDDAGAVIRRTEIDNPGALPRPSSRFRDILNHSMCEAIYGLMRTDIVRRTALGAFADSDRVLLAEMGLRGCFKLLPECLFSRRIHDAGTTRKYRTFRKRTIIFDPGKASKVFSPVGLQVMALLAAIRNAHLPITERVRSHYFLLGWLWTQRREYVVDEVREGVSSMVQHCLSEEQFHRLKAAKRRLVRAWSA